ncbi:eCIS core domain-containing protein [Nostoc sp.]|uniref:eCIS core domain-containing protein n=1 Tax=Nostoc sp. TaxID=1180 RepID=UPI002FEFA75C
MLTFSDLLNILGAARRRYRLYCSDCLNSVAIGQELLVHELTHVVQQNGGGEAIARALK